VGSNKTPECVKIMMHEQQMDTVTFHATQAPTHGLDAMANASKALVGSPGVEARVARVGASVGLAHVE
jgi:hypothetical protein